MNTGKIVLVLYLAGILISVGIAASNEKRSEALSAQSTISAEALKGPLITDLVIHVPPDVNLSRKVQIKAYYTNGTSKFSQNFFNVTPTGGIISYQFNDLLKGERIDIRLQTDQYGWLETSTLVTLRPDLVITSVTSADQVLAGETLSVKATVQETNGDTGANATLVLLNGELMLNSGYINVNAAGTTDAVLSAVLASRGEYNLSIRIMNSVPAEYDETNNTHSLVVRSVAPDLAVSNVSAPPTAVAGQAFEVLAQVSEQYGEVGANATIALIENGTVLDSTRLYVPASSSGLISLSGILDTPGTHDLSVRITGSSPSDANTANNEQPLTVRAVLPDLSVSGINAPASVASGQRFEVLANISELSGDTGANATIALIENGTVLDSKTQNVPGGSSVSVSLNGSLGLPGNHSLAVRITDSVPSDKDPENNELSFGIMVAKPIEPMQYTINYYHQNTFLNTSHYVTNPEYVDNSIDLVQKQTEGISFAASSTRILDYPVARIYIGITTESGESSIYEETNVTPDESGIFRKSYPENNATVTLIVNGTGTALSLESTANQTTTHSEGYLDWWFKPAQEWNVTETSLSGKLLNASTTLRVRVEIEDDQNYLGGNADITIGNQSFTGGWIDNTGGYFEERRAVLKYSGKGSGDTVP